MAADGNAAKALDLATNGFALTYNAMAERIGSNDRMVLERCAQRNALDPGECRFRMSRGETVVTINNTDGKTIKGILIRWTAAERLWFEYTEPQAVLINRCCPESTDAERMPI